MDVVFDTIGGEVFEESLRGTAWGARVLVVGFASGKHPSVRANYAALPDLGAENPGIVGPAGAREYCSMLRHLVQKCACYSMNLMAACCFAAVAHLLSTLYE